MHIVSETEERTIRTAAGVMSALAGPSQGSTELSTWRVQMDDGAQGPEHAIDREQVWVVSQGALAITVDGSTTKVSAGQAVILPAGELRQVRAIGTAEALVSMPIGGAAVVPGKDGTIPLPWAA